jgi:glutamate/tyrosine decarboxylase-like PLP-dependent enzyme
MMAKSKPKKSPAKKAPARKKKVLQLRGKDTIVYVRMKPQMWDVFEEAYAAHCEENMLNPQSYGMSTFVRENAFANLRTLGAV